MTVQADPDHVHRIFLNLFRNAIQAMGEGGALSASLARDGDGAVVIAVRDSGPGVPAHVRETLFEPFGRTGAKGGSGLGLSIARELARAMGGEVILAQNRRRGRGVRGQPARRARGSTTPRRAVKPPGMNYRHAFHAGNFADVLKHAVLALCLTHLTRKDKALRYIDTHAGIGRYDLTSDEARRSPEWQGGVARVLAAQRPAPVEAAFGALACRRQCGQPGRRAHRLSRLSGHRRERAAPS